jgi:hypothetical protein
MMRVSCFIICCAMASFAYMSAHAPRNTDTQLQLVDPRCNFRQQLVDHWNPFGCLQLRFSTSSHAGTTGARALDGTCAGPLVGFLHHTFRGDDTTLSLAEAQRLARAIREYLSAHASASPCGEAAAAAKAHVCFAAATIGERIERSRLGRFVGCLVADEHSHCQAIVCG